MRRGGGEIVQMGTKYFTVSSSNVDDNGVYSAVLGIDVTAPRDWIMVGSDVISALHLRTDG